MVSNNNCHLITSSRAFQVGPLYNKTQKLRERLARIQQGVIKVEQEVANLDEFKNLQGFAVVHQPFTLDISVSHYTVHAVVISGYWTSDRHLQQVHGKSQ